MAYKFVFNPLTAKFDLINLASATAAIPQYYSDPVAPAPEETWVLAIQFGASGHAMGVLGLTYTGDLFAFNYTLSYRTLEGTTVRTVLN